MSFECIRSLTRANGEHLRTKSAANEKTSIMMIYFNIRLVWLSVFLAHFQAEGVRNTASDVI